MLKSTLLVLALIANTALAVGSPICCVVPTDCCGKDDGGGAEAVAVPATPCCSHCPAPARDENPRVSSHPCACHPTDAAPVAHLDVPLPEIALALSTPRDESVAELLGVAAAPDARPVRSAFADRTPPLRL